MKQTLLIAGAAALIAAAPRLQSRARARVKARAIRTMRPRSMKRRACKVHGDHGKGTLYGYGRGGCPRAWPRRTMAACRRDSSRSSIRRGQILPATYGNRWSYNQIPTDLRSTYGLRPNSRFIYGDGYLYQVDPRTMLVQQVVNAIVR